METNKTDIMNINKRIKISDKMYGGTTDILNGPTQQEIAIAVITGEPVKFPDTGGSTHSVVIDSVTRTSKEDITFLGTIQKTDSAPEKEIIGQMRVMNNKEGWGYFKTFQD